MNKQLLQLISCSVILLDLVFLNLSVFLCALLFNVMNEKLGQAYWLLWIILNLSWLFIASVVRVYKLKSIFSFETTARQAMHAWFYWLIFVMLYLFFANHFRLSRLFTVVSMVSFGVLLFLNRLILLFLGSHYKGNNSMTRKVMIIGYNSMAKKLASYLEENEINTEIVGFCEETKNVYELTNYPILDSVENSVVASRQYQVDDIYSTIAPEQNISIYELMQEADKSCIHFRFIPDLSHFIKRNFFIYYLKDIPVMTLRQEPLSDAGNRIKKRIVDIVISLFVVVFILSWLIPVLGLLIYLESPGPIFFNQQRTGRNKKTFYCLKFRSMKVNNDAHFKQATINDNRLTKVGKIIRRTNLDEFPQFINVLKGEMSIVGPRPHMLKHTDDYSRIIDQYMVRQFLKPGITGWAQIHGFRGEVKAIHQLRDRVEHDIWYMENWGLWLDIRIISLTLFNMINGEKNAY